MSCLHAGGWHAVASLVVLVITTVNAAETNVKQRFFAAAKDGNRELVELLLKNGADVNAEGEFGETALGQAAENGHREVVELLLKNGADVNAKEYGIFGGATFLIFAAARGHREVVEVLLKNWADVNAWNSGN
jgi:ankyrin repeat protein